MNAVDHTIILSLDYVMIGLFKVSKDFSASPKDRRGYTINPRPIIVLLALLTWPVGISLDLHHEIKMHRGKHALGTLFVNIVLVISLFLWTKVAYLIAGYLSSSFLLRIIITIPFLLFFIFFVGKVTGRKRNFI